MTAEVIRQWSTLHPEFSFLPRKFKIAVTGAPNDRAAVKVHDIGLRMLRNEAGEPGAVLGATGLLSAGDTGVTTIELDPAQIEALRSKNEEPRGIGIGSHTERRDDTDRSNAMGDRKAGSRIDGVGDAPTLGLIVVPVVARGGHGQAAEWDDQIDGLFVG